MNEANSNHTGSIQEIAANLRTLTHTVDQMAKRIDKLEHYINILEEGSRKMLVDRKQA